MPYIKDKINNELDKNVQEMESEIRKQIQGKSYITTLPKLGWKKEEILQEIDQMMALGNNSKGVCKYSTMLCVRSNSPFSCSIFSSILNI